MHLCREYLHIVHALTLEVILDVVDADDGHLVGHGVHRVHLNVLDTWHKLILLILLVIHILCTRLAILLL